MGVPASWARAIRCSTVLVEQPRAISTVRAFSNAAGVRMDRGVIFFSSSSMIFMPASFARRNRADITAGMVPLPGRPRPITSVRQFMELAVNMPEHDPQVGQAASSMASSSSSAIFPARTAPTASKTDIRSTFRVGSKGCRPASMGPPLMKIAGRSSRAAAMSMPGTILSQLGTITMASKAWAVAMTSTESAISSRLPREYFMPTWFMAMPSQTPMTPNSTGVPPAI